MTQPRQPDNERDSIYQRNPKLGKVSESMIPALKQKPPRTPQEKQHQQAAPRTAHPAPSRQGQAPPAPPASPASEPTRFTGRAQRSRQQQAQNRAVAPKHQGRTAAPGKLKPEVAERLRRKDPLRLVGRAVASPFVLPPAAKRRHRLVRTKQRKATAKEAAKATPPRSDTPGKGRISTATSAQAPKPDYAPWAAQGASPASAQPADFQQLFGTAAKSKQGAARSGQSAMRGRAGTSAAGSATTAPFRATAGAAAPQGNIYLREQMLAVGRHIWGWGRGRGGFALFVLLLAFLWPFLHSPPRTSEAAVLPPAFLAGFGDAYAFVTLLGILLVGVAIILLPMLVRGGLLLALGLAPFVAYYAGTLLFEPQAYAMPEALAQYTQLATLLFPAWVAMAAGMVVGQNFPDWLPGRLLAALGGVVVIAVEFFGGFLLANGVDFFANPVLALLRLLVLALALTAIGTLIRPSLVATISFVKAGMLYLLAVPVVFVLYQAVGMKAALPSDVFYTALHALLFLLGALLVAIVGLAEILHTFAWNREVRDTLGKSVVGLDPRTIEFEERYLACGIADGVLGEEDAALLRQERKYTPG